MWKNLRRRVTEFSWFLQARREKISERMKILQDLVPGCNKVQLYIHRSWFLSPLVVGTFWFCYHQITNFLHSAETNTWILVWSGYRKGACSRWDNQLHTVSAASSWGAALLPLSLCVTFFLFVYCLCYLTNTAFVFSFYRWSSKQSTQEWLLVSRFSRQKRLALLWYCLSVTLIKIHCPKFTSKHFMCSASNDIVK